jgi:thiol-disulfide isomerase/thioredoxin
MIKIKKLLIVLLLVSVSIQSQNNVTGTLTTPNDDEFSWVALYQLKGAKQIYITDTTIANGKFTVEIPQNTSKGMYRLLYKMDGKSFIDFIYDNENINLKFDPNNPLQTLVFLASEENKIYNSYLKKSNDLKQQLDALQYSYFGLKTDIEKDKAHKDYQNLLKTFHENQFQYEAQSSNKLANHFIKTGNKYYSKTLIESPQIYMNNEKAHFFDFINFSDPVLINSTVISQNVLNYVFYLNVSEDVSMQIALYKSAINEVMGKIGENILLKSEIITTLLYSFSQSENVTLINYLLENYYNKLPEAVKNNADIKTILDKVKLAVGKLAPDFSWEENGTSQSLYKLNKATTYVLVFWSTSCSHCINEIPEFYEYSKTKTNFKVIDVAIENEAELFDKYASKFTEWINVLGLNKWQNPIARSYEINSTPTYFILDSKKIIIAKPLYLEDVKAFFGD